MTALKIILIWTELSILTGLFLAPMFALNDRATAASISAREAATAPREHPSRTAMASRPIKSACKKRPAFGEGR